ncbi:phenylalanine--tRNA ligase subunit alpha [Candidatus Acetothermia bacterium]|nr:phenylalanine--tRNA ligase subunit alpha [Candidatus Acetothermia bacterium]
MNEPDKPGTYQNAQRDEDLTLPGRQRPLGSLHLLTQVQKQLEDLFVRMGFDLMTGSELETAHYQFDALQHPKDSLARAEAFYLNDNLLLRTSPASMAVRALEKRRPPVRVLCSARCYQRDIKKGRRENAIVSHRSEALWIDRGLGFAHLKALVQLVLDEFFGKGFETQTHWVESPYTRLSIEVQARRRSGSNASGNPWKPILSGGLIDTAVLQEVDYDPEIYSGFVLGLVIEPIAMLKYGIDDDRTLYQNDMRFLETF